MKPAPPVTSTRLSCIKKTVLGAYIKEVWELSKTHPSDRGEHELPNAIDCLPGLSTPIIGLDSMADDLANPVTGASGESVTW